MTLFGVRQLARSMAVCLLITTPGVAAQPHVVSPAELHNELAGAAGSRQRNLETVNGFLSSPPAERALRGAGIDSGRVRTAISTLDSDELARLAARAAQAEADLTAGRLTDRDLLIILIGIAALILIIVAVR